MKMLKGNIGLGEKIFFRSSIFLTDKKFIQIKTSS